MFFFFNDTATTEIYTLSLHDALPISDPSTDEMRESELHHGVILTGRTGLDLGGPEWRLRLELELSSYGDFSDDRSEEHTSELQSRQYLVCRLLLEKKTKIASLFTFSS